MTNRLATDELQSVVWRWEGEAFGNTPADELAGISINLRFPGQYFDEETNLHYNWNRYYDPELGRYITSDPVGLFGGNNTYGYVFQSPTILFDSLGLDVSGAWEIAPRVEPGSFLPRYVGFDPTFGFDKYLTVLLVRLNYNVTGNIVAEVRCWDECGGEWTESYSKRLSTKRHIDLGINLVATGAGLLTGKKLVAFVLNAIIIDLKLNEGLQNLDSDLKATAALINDYGADAVCQFGWPSI
jgi:RHS repeat-associated protein